MNAKEREKIDAKKKHIHPRSMARYIAHVKFKSEGFDNVNKRFYYRGRRVPSYFATHWRDKVNG
jgi:hypothetical protein